MLVVQNMKLTWDISPTSMYNCLPYLLGTKPKPRLNGAPVRASYAANSLWHLELWQKTTPDMPMTGSQHYASPFFLLLSTVPKLGISHVIFIFCDKAVGQNMNTNKKVLPIRTFPFKIIFIFDVLKLIEL